MKKYLVLCMMLGLTMMAGCSKAPEKAAEVKQTPIVKVNGSVISKEEFDKKYNTAIQNSSLAAQKVDIKDPKNKFITLIFKDRVINELIIQELVEQESAKRKITVSDEEVGKEIDKISEKLGGKDKLEAMLTLNNINKDELTENVKLDLLARKLVDNISLGIKVSEKDAKAFYEQNKESKFKNPEMVRAKHILIGASEADIKAKVEAENSGLPAAEVNKKIQAEVKKAEVKAKDILNKIKADPTKFEELAKANSEDPSSAQKGGDLGYFGQRDMVPAFGKVAFTTLPGNVSDIVRTDFGFHIIKVVDRKKAGTVPFAEVKNDLVKYLADQQKGKVVQKLIEDAKNKAKIEYVDAEFNPKKIQEEVKELAKQNPNQIPGKPAAKQEAKASK